jgi:hypothetical protein
MSSDCIGPGAVVTPVTTAVRESLNGLNRFGGMDWSARTFD